MIEAKGDLNQKQLQRQRDILMGVYDSPKVTVEAMILVIEALPDKGRAVQELVDSPFHRAIPGVAEEDSPKVLVDLLINSATIDPAYSAIVSERVPKWKAYLERYQQDPHPKLSLEWILP